MQKKETFKNKKAKSKQVKQLAKYKAGDFGPDDGSVREEKDDKFLTDAIKKEGLTEEYIENEDIN